MSVILLKICWSYVKGTLLLFNSLSQTGIVKFIESSLIISQFPRLDTDESARRVQTPCCPASSCAWGLGEVL